MNIVQIQVGSQVQISPLIGKILQALTSGKKVEVSGINFATSNTIRVVEFVKEKMPDLYQINLFETVAENAVKFSVTLSTKEMSEGDCSPPAERAIESQPKRGNGGYIPRRGRGYIPRRTPYYQRGPPRKQTHPQATAAPNEFYVKSDMGLKGHLVNAAQTLESGQTATIKAAGLAISKALRLYDLLRSGIEGIHSSVNHSVDDFTLETQGAEKTRSLPTIHIKMSKNSEEVPNSSVGYQPPVDSENMVKLAV